MQVFFEFFAAHRKQCRKNAMGKAPACDGRHAQT
jgi:hypothetical protein